MKATEENISKIINEYNKRVDEFPAVAGQTTLKTEREAEFFRDLLNEGFKNGKK